MCHARKNLMTMTMRELTLFIYCTTVLLWYGPIVISHLLETCFVPIFIGHHLGTYLDLRQMITESLSSYVKYMGVLCYVICPLFVVLFDIISGKTDIFLRIYLWVIVISCIYILIEVYVINFIPILLYAFK